jgi:ATP-binding cassette, subfamily B, bacterial
VSATTTTPPAEARPLVVLRAGLALIARFVREQPRVFALAITGSVSFASAIVASAFVIGWVSDEVIIPVLGGGASREERLLAGVALVLGVSVWKALSIVTRRASAGWLQFRAVQRLRARLVRHQLGLSLRWYASRSVGDLLSVSSNDADQATNVLAPLPFATGVTFLLFASTGFIVAIDPLLGLLAGALLALVVLLDAVGSWRAFREMEEVQARRAVLSGVAHESFDGALTVKALGREAVEVDRFGTAAASLRDQIVRVGRTWTGYRAATEALPAFGSIVILVVGVARITTGDVRTGQLVTIAYLLSLMTVPIRLIGYLLWDLANSVAGWNRVAEVLAVEDRVAHGDVGTVHAGPADVAVSGVAFGYEPGMPVLSGLDVTVGPGRTVAVVGPTGSGKSTFALLLARLWDPDDGTVRLDGRDLRALAPGVVPSEVAFVPQEAFLFDDTVAGNVALGDPSIDDDAVVSALGVAGASGFVSALPEGIHTRIGERGTTLSGGQRQRIALARAVARRPRLLVLDDATSAVDPSVEAAILRRLREADLPSTVVIVAYRRASIVLADEVIYLEEGRVVDHGPHAEVLARTAGYARLLQAYEDDAARRREERADGAVRRVRPPTSPDAKRPDDAAGKDHA